MKNLSVGYETNPKNAKINAYLETSLQNTETEKKKNTSFTLPLGDIEISNLDINNRREQQKPYKKLDRQDIQRIFAKIGNKRYENKITLF